MNIEYLIFLIIASLSVSLPILHYLYKDLRELNEDKINKEWITKNKIRQEEVLINLDLDYFYYKLSRARGSVCIAIKNGKVYKHQIHSSAVYSYSTTRVTSIDLVINKIKEDLKKNNTVLIDDSHPLNEEFKRLEDNLKQGA